MRTICHKIVLVPLHFDSNISAPVCPLLASDTPLIHALYLLKTIIITTQIVNIYHSLFTTLYDMSDSFLPMSNSAREVIALFLESRDVWSKLDTCTFLRGGGGHYVWDLSVATIFSCYILGDHCF